MASLNRLIVGSVVVAAAGFLLLAIGLFVDPVRTWYSYLTAFTFAVSIAFGAQIFELIGYASNARWFSVTRRLSGSITATFPVLALLFVPILVGAGQIYPWLDPPSGASHRELELIAHRAPYLNLPFFAVRSAIYFAVWITAAEVLRAWSLRRDRQSAPANGDPEDALSRERAFSCAMLPVIGLAITFAAFDWIMSLETDWLSSIFGIYYFAGGFVAGIALVTLLVHLTRRAGPLAALTLEHFHALGRLVFAFIIFWAYCAFFQALLIAIADKPAEVSFYVERMGGIWAGFVWVLILGHFLLPFLLLLPREIKRKPRFMAVVSGWVLLMHLCDVYWLVIPEKAQGLMVFHWVDLAALAAVVGSAIAFAAWRQRGVPLLARQDPFLPEGLAYRSPN